MEELKVERPGRPQKHADPILVSSILLLAGLGFVTLYSSSNATPDQIFPGGQLFANGISKQITCEFIGIMIFLIASIFPIELLRRSVIPLIMFAVIIFFCYWPLTRQGVTINGATRWVEPFGLRFQPSEIIKVLIPLYFAHIADRKQVRINIVITGILPLVILTSTILSLLVFGQNDLSTAIIMGVDILALFVMSGGKRGYAITAFLVMIIAGALFILTDPGRVGRVRVFFNQEHDPQDLGFQLIQSKRSVSRGSFWGTGIGQTLENSSIPETEPDFIFSYYAERFGFIGVVLFFILFIIFAMRSYMASAGSGETFRRLVAGGLITILAVQTLMTVAVAVGSLPVTGITLPFFSSGGTSLIITYAIVGIIVNVSRTPTHSGFPERVGDFSKLRFSLKKGGWYYASSGVRNGR
jgi:cell division protein FtsW